MDTDPDNREFSELQEETARIFNKIEAFESQLVEDFIREDNYLEDTSIDIFKFEDYFEKTVAEKAETLSEDDYFERERRNIQRDLVITVFKIIMLFVFLGVLFSSIMYIESLRPRLLKKTTTNPFFDVTEPNFHDFSNGSLETQRNVLMSINMLYSPHSFASRRFRQDFARAAAKLNEQQKEVSIVFNAINCFTKKGDCVKKFKVVKFPVIYARVNGFSTAVYNGPLSDYYLNRWMNRLLNIVVKVSTFEDLEIIHRQFQMSVLAYIPDQKYATNKYYRNFTKAAYEYSNGDPNIELFTYGIITSEKVANNFGITEPNTVLVIKSDFEVLKIIPVEEWAQGKLNEHVKKLLVEVLRRRVYFLNKPVNNLATEQISAILKDGSAILLSQEQPGFMSDSMLLFNQVAKDYWNCGSFLAPEVNSTTGFITGMGCSFKPPLQFICIDRNLHPNFDKTVVSINPMIEMANTLNSTLDKASLEAMILQYHELSDNPFVVDTATPYETRNEPQPHNEHHDFPTVEISNVGEFLGKPKDYIVLFTAGASHGPSTTALADFHLIAEHFKKYQKIIKFVVFDTSHSKIPFNFNFDRLPRLLLSRANSVATSFVLPDVTPITKTTIVEFIRSNASLFVRVAVTMKNCDIECKIRNIRKLRSEKKRLRRVLMRCSFGQYRLRHRLAEIQTLIRTIAL